MIKQTMTDREVVTWLSGIMCEYFADVRYGAMPGCLCMCCYGYTITWEDENGKEIEVFGDTLWEAVQKGAEIIKNPWGF